MPAFSRSIVFPLSTNSPGPPTASPSFDRSAISKDIDFRPGQSVSTEELWIAPGLHLDDWASKVAKRYKPKLPDQPPVRLGRLVVGRSIQCRAIRRCRPP